MISPIGGIENKGNFQIFHSETEVGPITTKLYETLVGIQYGDIEGPEGWVEEVDL